MSTTALSTRHPRGINSKGRNLQQSLRKNGFKLPEYLERDEVNALIAAAPNPRARLIMLEQWRAGLRVSEALAQPPSPALPCTARRPCARSPAQRRMSHEPGSLPKVVA